MLNLPQLHELLFAQITIVVDRFLPVRTVDGLDIRVRVVRVIWRWDKLSGPQCRHPSFVRFHMVVFFVWERRYVVGMRDEFMTLSYLRTCVKIFNVLCKLFLALIFRYRLWIDLALLDEPCMKLGRFGEDTARMSVHHFKKSKSLTRLQ